tara:strand:- start:269 stop:388 length:120 start_codon:yes stop_codon:yes gene_type:complete
MGDILDDTKVAPLDSVALNLSLINIYTAGQTDSFAQYEE